MRLKTFFLILLIPVVLSGCQTLSCRQFEVTGPSHFIISPADGMISSIVEIKEGAVPEINDAGKTAYLKELAGKLTGDYRLILIFMKPFNYHGILSPLDGTVAEVSHTPGSFRNLYEKDAYLENERSCVLIDGEVRLAIIPVAGFLYRRIRLDVFSGDSVARGACIGRILWGSAVGIMLPATCPLRVKVGEKVRVGKSIIAELPQ